MVDFNAAQGTVSDGWVRPDDEGSDADIPTNCPYDTNGDGDCGRPACPYCSDERRRIKELKQ